MDSKTLPKTNSVEKDKSINVVSSKKIRTALNVSPLTKILVVLVILLFVSNFYFIYQYAHAKEKVTAMTRDIMATDQINESPVSTEKTKSKGSTITLDHLHTIKLEETNKYPYKIDVDSQYVPTKVWQVSINSLEDIRKKYQSASEEGCAGVCSALAEGDTLEKQFELLTKVSQVPQCELTEELEGELKTFMLFAKGPDDKKLIETIYNEHLDACGIKYVAHDGFDYWLGNYVYNAGFIKDGKVIHISFQLYPFDKYAEIDHIWSDIGYDFENQLFQGDDNYKKMEDYMDTIDLTKGVEKKLIDRYDTSVKSFDFTE